MIAAGSSPLARGLPQGLFELLGDRRIIPARAGFTAKGGVWYRSSADHPRSRGVYMRSPSFICDTAGSSPLARGLQIGGPLVIHRSRIIPARAGFTRQLLELRRGLWDHPRSRGVYGQCCEHFQSADGSSPLARGLLGMFYAIRFPNGIIPARAGFTSPMNKSVQTAQDHPRSRGVYSSTNTYGAALSGSSPLARGLLAVQGGSEWRFRIIPARAGFTPSRRGTEDQATDHPRSRGVYRPRL